MKHDPPHRVKGLAKDVVIGHGWAASLGFSVLAGRTVESFRQASPSSPENCTL
jgi:hypothetical protein